MKKRSTFEFKKIISLIIILISALSFSVNAQCRLLNETFDVNPVLSPINIDGAWYPDRYRPAGFVSGVLAGNNVLKISIDGIGDGSASRPPGQQGTFYNTQGRKFNQCGNCVTVMKGNLWIPADWATDHRRSDMWATAFNSSNIVSFYPILGFRNPDAVSPGIYFWNGIAWVNSGVVISYDSWYSLEFRLAGGNVEYLVNNIIVGTVPSGGSVYFGDVMLQAYNFNDPALAVPNQSTDSYDAYWDNVITTGTGGNLVTNINTGQTFCSIQAAINSAATLSGHTISVGPGTYNENVTINKNNIELISSGGKGVTTIQGITSPGAGAVMVANGINGVKIGKPGKGFTIIGFDGNGAIESAALYLLGAHTNITIEDNEIRANGDHGLLSNFNAAIDGIYVKGNMFTGKTFMGASPGGCGFSTQFDPGNNVPRQLVTMGGGSGVTNSRNVFFLDNMVTGTAGGSSTEPGCTTTGQGNNLVTIDVIGCTISGNTFNGVSSRFANSLRTRGPASNIFCNTFFTTGLGPQCGNIFFGAATPLTGASPSTLAGVASQNAFPNGGAYLSPDHAASYVIYLNMAQATAAATAIGAGQTAVAAAATATNCPVLNVNTGMIFPTIQSAINSSFTLNGHVIQVAAGTYTVPASSTILVNKQLTLKGANFGVCATGTRSAESKIVVNHSSGFAMTIRSGNVTVDGFEFETQLGRDAINVNTPYVASALSTMSNFNFSNNIFRSSTTSANKNGIVFGENNLNGNQATPNDQALNENVTIQCNKFDYTTFAATNRGIVMTTQFDMHTYNNFNISDNLFQMGVNGTGIVGSAVPNRHTMTNFNISDNTFTSGLTGLDLTKVETPTIENNSFANFTFKAMGVGSSNGGVVRGNTIDGASAALLSGGSFFGYGIDLYGGTDFGTPANGPTGNNGGLVVENNEISNFTHPTETAQNFRAINIRNNPATGLMIKNNTINNVQNGVLIASTATNVINVNENSFTSATTAIRNNSTTMTVAGTCNWYGSNVPAAVAAKISGPVIYGPWLSNGTDGSAAIGFQPTASCNAVPATALHFDGVNDYVNVGNPPALNFTTQSFTLQASVYPTGAGSPSVGGVILNKEGEYEFARFPDGSLQYAFANTSPGWVWVNTGIILPLNTWTDITVIYDRASNQVKVYTNGIGNSFTAPVTGDIGDAHSAQNEFWIGGRAAVSQFFQGSIDEVRVWNRALCTLEITSYKTCELGGSLPGLVAHYKLNNGIVGGNNAGLTNADDASTNAYHGTLNNFALVGATSNWTDGIVTGVCAPYVAATITCPGNIITTTDPNLCTKVVTYTTTVTGSPVPAVSFELTGATTAGPTPGNGSGATFNKGVTTVKVTVTNGCGTADCSFTVTVNDTETPTITCPASATRLTNSGLCTYKVQNSEFNATATDNCAVTSLTYVLSGATTGTGTGNTQTLKDVLLNRGTTTVTWTAKDAANNTVSCSFTVTVNDDQNSTNYLIYAEKDVEFGEYNYIGGDVGVTAANGKAKFKKNSVLDPFTITAKNIDVHMPASVNNRVYSPATGGPNPTFYPYNGNTSSLSNIEVTVNGTLNGNWKDVKVKKGVTCTITGNCFGKITIEEGAKVTFTAAMINLEKMYVQNGRKQNNVLTVVNFSNPAWVKVKDKIEVGDDCRVNVGGPKVTFYMGDNSGGEEKFEVMGENSQVTANIMIPNGKLHVHGGNDISRPTIMTGWYIIEKLDSHEKYVYWNKYDCGNGNFSLVQQSTQPEVKPEVPAVVTPTVTQPVDEFRVNVYPNPAAYEFNIQVISTSNEPVTVRILDMNGKVLQVLAKQTKANSIRVGDKLVGGTYMAEVIQGNSRKLVKLVKMN